MVGPPGSRRGPAAVVTPARAVAPLAAPFAPSSACRTWAAVHRATLARVAEPGVSAATGAITSLYGPFRDRTALPVTGRRCRPIHRRCRTPGPAVAIRAPRRDAAFAARAAITEATLPARAAIAITIAEAGITTAEAAFAPRAAIPEATLPARAAIAVTIAKATALFPRR